MKARRGAKRRPANHASSMGGRGSCSLAGSLGGLGGFFGAYERGSPGKGEWGRPDLNWSLQLPKLEG